MKNSKTYSQRIKITKNGKTWVRRPGLNHFRSRKTRNDQLRRKSWRQTILVQKIKDRFLPKENKPE